jgi:Phospholipase B
MSHTLPTHLVICLCLGVFIALDFNVCESVSALSSTNTHTQSDSEATPSPHLKLPQNNTWYTAYLAVEEQESTNLDADPVYNFVLKPGRDLHNGVAVGLYSNETTTKGLSRLYIETSPHAPSLMQAHAAGFVEGSLSVDGTLSFTHNFDMWNLYPLVKLTNIFTFYQTWADFIDSQINAYAASEPYWMQASIIREQLRGLVQGYNSAKPTGAPEMEFMFMFMLNSLVELVDVYYAPTVPKNGTTGTTGSSSMPYYGPEVVIERDPAHVPEAHGLSDTEIRDRVVAFIDSTKGLSHCSSLVKVAPDQSDVLFAQCTWAQYITMVRVWKSIILPLNSDDGGASSMTASHIKYSSYPMILWSQDDFYIANSGLAVMETTNNVYNTSAYEALNASSTVPCSWRTMLANRMATSPQQWTEVFSKFNSGTYNNQWIVLSHVGFQPGQPLPHGLLWIAEQTIDFVHSADMTSNLTSTSYWSSYNIPAFMDVWYALGYGMEYLSQNRSVELTHNGCARAVLFDRLQSTTNDLMSMRSTMRYNRFRTDPASRMNPMLSIASRGDLAIDPKARMAFGETDCKVSSLRQLVQMQFDSISGPTHETQPVFKWSTSDFAKKAHLGQPDSWDFEWIDNVLPSMS